MRLQDVARLRVKETARLDCARLEALVRGMGEAQAERFVCRRLEDVALQLNRVDSAWRRGDVARVRQGADDIAGLAAAIGLTTLSRVARDVSGVVPRGDMAALAATTGRLTRIGEASLMSIWDQQDRRV